MTDEREAMRLFMDILSNWTMKLNKVGCEVITTLDPFGGVFTVTVKKGSDSSVFYLGVYSVMNNDILDSDLKNIFLPIIENSVVK